MYYKWGMEQWQRTREQEATGMSTPTVTIMCMGMHTPTRMTGIRTNIITTITTMHMGIVTTTITRMSTAHGSRIRTTRHIRTSTAV